MSIPAKTICKTTNCHDDNRALGQRGSLTVWLDPETVWEAAPDRRSGQFFEVPWGHQRRDLWLG